MKKDKKIFIGVGVFIALTLVGAFVLNMKNKIDTKPSVTETSGVVMETTQHFEETTVAETQETSEALVSTEAVLPDTYLGQAQQVVDISKALIRKLPNGPLYEDDVVLTQTSKGYIVYLYRAKETEFDNELDPYPLATFEDNEPIGDGYQMLVDYVNRHLVQTRDPYTDNEMVKLTRDELYNQFAFADEFLDINQLMNDVTIQDTERGKAVVITNISRIPGWTGPDSIPVYGLGDEEYDPYEGDILVFFDDMLVNIQKNWSGAHGGE